MDPLILVSIPGTGNTTHQAVALIGTIPSFRHRQERPLTTRHGTTTTDVHPPALQCRHQISTPLSTVHQTSPASPSRPPPAYPPSSPAAGARGWPSPAPPGRSSAGTRVGAPADCVFCHRSSPRCTAGTSGAPEGGSRPSSAGGGGGQTGVS